MSPSAAVFEFRSFANFKGNLIAFLQEAQPLPGAQARLDTSMVVALGVTAATGAAFIGLLELSLAMRGQHRRHHVLTDARVLKVH